MRVNFNEMDGLSQPPALLSSGARPFLHCMHKASVDLGCLLAAYYVFQVGIYWHQDPRMCGRWTAGGPSFRFGCLTSLASQVCAPQGIFRASPNSLQGLKFNSRDHHFKSLPPRSFIKRLPLLIFVQWVGAKTAISKSSPLIGPKICPPQSVASGVAVRGILKGGEGSGVFPCEYI